MCHQELRQVKQGWGREERELRMLARTGGQAAPSFGVCAQQSPWQETEQKALQPGLYDHMQWAPCCHQKSLKACGGLWAELANKVHHRHRAARAVLHPPLSQPPQSQPLQACWYMAMITGMDAWRVAWSSFPWNSPCLIKKTMGLQKEYSRNCFFTFCTTKGK